MDTTLIKSLLILCTVITGGGLIYFYRLYKEYKEKYTNISYQIDKVVNEITNIINGHYAVCRVSKRIGRANIIQELTTIRNKLNNLIDWVDIDLLVRIGKLKSKNK